MKTAAKMVKKIFSSTVGPQVFVSLQLRCIS
jgi:hypothetical protein